MELPRQGNDWLPRFWLNVGRVDYDQLPSREPLGRDEVKNFKSIVSRCLTVFIVRHESTAEVRRQDFRCPKVLSCKGRLARAGRADKGDDREFWNLQFHSRSKIPI